MRKTGHLLVLLFCALLTLTAVVVSLAHATDTDGSWFATDLPSLSKAVSLPANRAPAAQNINCDNVTYYPSPTSSTTSNACVADTPIGSLSTNSQLFTDPSHPDPLIHANSNGAFVPVPGSSELMLQYFQTGNMWSYAGFYNSLHRGALSTKVTPGGLQYVVNSDPAYWVVDGAGQKIPLNLKAFAFSANAQWMVVDSPIALLRVNLSTGTVLPFATALSQQYWLGLGIPSGQLSISNDGRFVAASQVGGVGGFSPNLKVYDLSTCDATVSGQNVFGSMNCQSRDIWNGTLATTGKGDAGISPAIPGASWPTNIRFIDDDNITFNVKYNVSGGNFDAATYLATAPGAISHKIGLLGMGDSYISGEGAFEYIKDTDTSLNKCHLSSSSYPYLLGAEHFNSFNSVACSGATTGDVNPAPNFYEGQVSDHLKLKDRNREPILQSFSPGYLPQINFIQNYAPQTVLLSIGGNDMGFGNILTRCISPFSAGDSHTCYESYEDRYELLAAINKTFSDLVNTYQNVKAAAPGGRIYVIGYPDIIKPDGDCGLNVQLNQQETEFANQLVTYMDKVIEQAADKSGVYYVDTQHAFDGHRLCEQGEPAVNGVTAGHDRKFVIGNETYHPTKFGHELLANAIDAATHNLAAEMPVADPDIPSPTVSVDEPILVNMTKQNRKVYQTHQDDAMTDSILFKGSATSLNADGLTDNLATNSDFDAVLHSDPIDLGILHSDADGNIIGTVTIPAAIPTGLHVLHLYGKDFAGNDIDIQKTVYVAASADDFDGDGIPNIQSACWFFAGSNVDVDQDGIDDACDPVIGPAPVHQTDTDSDLDQKNDGGSVQGSGEQTVGELRGVVTVESDVMLVPTPISSMSENKTKNLNVNSQTLESYLAPTEITSPVTTKVSAESITRPARLNAVVKDNSAPNINYWYVLSAGVVCISLFALVRQIKLR